jgi:hypothetical protein
MNGLFLEPWIVPPEPSLMRLALEAADEEGLDRCDAWPEGARGGVVFGGLPPFLTWHGILGGRHHLLLLQAREVGALVPGARITTLPEGWLENLDLVALARPLSRHPAFPGGAAVHVVRVLGPGRAALRSLGESPGGVPGEVLARVSGVDPWEVKALRG